MSNQIFQFKITLNDFDPKIWRRIQVPGDYTFWDLHCAIQDAMGWMNCHLHGFRISKQQKEPYRPICIQIPNPEWDTGDELDESKEKLRDWFPNEIKQCVYTYDFGDSWDHTVLFEKVLERDPKKSYPTCLAGKNTCPPEDCGGTCGYERLLHAMKNHQTPEEMQLRDWLGLEAGETYDSTEFNPSDIVFADPKQWLKEYLGDQELYR